MYIKTCSKIIRKTININAIFFLSLNLFLFYLKSNIKFEDKHICGVKLEIIIYQMDKTFEFNSFCNVCKLGIRMRG